MRLEVHMIPRYSHIMSSIMAALLCLTSAVSGQEKSDRLTPMDILTAISEEEL